MISAEERFWAKVDKTGECWLWTASAAGRGKYGGFWDGSRMVYAHRFAYELVMGPIPNGVVVDHHFTCSKRCVRFEHLRLATNKQNCENLTGPHRDSTSGVRGVSWHKKSQRWRAQIGHNGQLVWVGEFKVLEDAAAAVIAKRKELFTHNDLDRMDA